MLKDNYFAIRLAVSLMLFVSVSLLTFGLNVSEKSTREIKKSEDVLVQGVADVDGVEKARTEIVLVGDIMLGRSVMGVSLDKDNPEYPFEKVRDELGGADIVFANLENPVIDNCPQHDDGYIFCASPEMLEGLKRANVNVVSLANNHSLNYGKEGLEETVKYLEMSEIKATGLGELVKVENKGISFGFLGFEYVSKAPKQEDYDLVESSSRKTDVLIVGIHWGVEYTPEPTNSQRVWAQKFIENGAGMVIGHHPHWVQISEEINSKPVYYSLGNFVFDQMWSEETKKGLAVRLIFEGDEIVKKEELPTYMSSFAQPEFVE